jgi:hypothetical protein
MPRPMSEASINLMITGSFRFRGDRRDHRHRLAQQHDVRGYQAYKAAGATQAIRIGKSISPEYQRVSGLPVPLDGAEPDRRRAAVDFGERPDASDWAAEHPELGIGGAQPC